MIISFVWGDRTFGDKVLDFMVLPGATFVISYRKYVAACNFVVLLPMTSS